jgi:hypothetical protein
MKKMLGLIAILISLTACGHITPTVETKIDPDVKEYIQDRNDCLKEVSFVQPFTDVTNCELFVVCMGTKGYSILSDGLFDPTKESLTLIITKDKFWGIVKYNKADDSYVND